MSPTALGVVLFKAIVMFIIIVCAVFGNTLCIWILHRNHSILHEVTRVFMTSMSLSDLCVATMIGIPIFWATITDTWPFGELFCTATAFLNCIFMFTSTYSLLVVNFERYAAVAWPYKYSTYFSLKRAIFVVIFIWIISISFAYLYVFTSGRRVVYKAHFHSCLADSSQEDELDILGAIYVVFIALVPLSVCTISHIRLYLIARYHSRQIAALTVHLPGPNTTLDTNKRNLKAATTFLIMTFSLAISWMPFVAVVTYENLTKTDPPVICMYLALILLLMNTCQNFVIFYLRNEVFRTCAKKLVMSWCR